MILSFPLRLSRETPFVGCTTGPADPGREHLSVNLLLAEEKALLQYELSQVEEKAESCGFWRLTLEILKKGRNLELTIDQGAFDSEEEVLASLEACSCLLPLYLLSQYRALDDIREVSVLFAAEGSTVPGPLHAPELLEGWNERASGSLMLMYACAEDMPTPRRQKCLGSMDALKELYLSPERRLKRLSMGEKELGVRCMPLPSGENWLSDVAAGMHFYSLDFFAPDSGDNQFSYSLLTWQKVFNVLAGTKVCFSGLKNRPPILAGTLLEQAFQADVRPRIFPPKGKLAREQQCHVILQGTAGTGKTTLGRLMMLHALLNDPAPHIVYMGPTRMLVEEAYEKFRTLVGELARESRFSFLDVGSILISTGERAEDDERIGRGDFRVLFIVYEKLNNFFYDNRLNSLLTLVMVDEVQMLGDNSRGGILDVLLSRLCREARERAADVHACSPLRLIICTTEAFSLREQFRLEVRIPGRLHRESRAPIVLEDKRRMLPVSTWYQHVSSKRESFPVFLGRSKERKVRGSSGVQRNVCLVARKGRKDRRQAWLTEWMWGHQKVLYISPSPLMMIFLAKRLCKDRPVIFADEEWATRFFSLLRENELHEDCCRILVECARKGVFFNFSTMGHRARQMSVDKYCELPVMEGVPLITFATSTIMYGVNLPADLLILWSLKWPRKKEKRYVFEYLSPCELHNFTGRVGRYGVSASSVIPTVVLCGQRPAEMSASGFDLLESSAECENVIAQLSRPEVSIRSVILARQQYFQVNSLGDFFDSEQMFLMSALLHSSVQREHGGARKLFAVLNFIKTTWSWRSVCEQGRQDDWEKAIPLFFQFLQKDFPEAVKLSRLGDDLLIYPLSLCDMVCRTGTPLEMLRELREILMSWDADSFPDRARPVLVLISVLLTQEGWREALAMLQESSQWGKDGGGRITDNQKDLLEHTAEQEQTVQRELVDKLMKLMDGNRAQTVIEYIKRYFDMHNMPTTIFKKPVCDLGKRRILMAFRAVLMVFDWCRGASDDEINRHRYASGEVPKDAGTIIYEYNFREMVRSVMSYNLVCLESYCTSCKDLNTWKQAVHEAGQALWQTKLLGE